MHTPPADLPESALRAALADGWSLTASTLEYRAVGFGSHHWELTDATGVRRFVSVDDLRTRRFVTDEPLAAAFGRLRAALAAALALRAAGRDFVVAPLPARDGEPLTRLGDNFAVAVYPFVAGESFGWGTHTPEQRRAVLDLLAAVHSAPPEVVALAGTDDYAVQCRDAITAVLEKEAVFENGPYAQPTFELLTAHAPVLRRVLARYDDMVAALRADPPPLVLTHGEPHPGNTMRTGDGWLLIDWDTVLAAPRERDLWSLETSDGDSRRKDLYRLRWDLSDLGVGVARFREPHGATADDQETWDIIKETVTGLTREGVSRGS